MTATKTQKHFIQRKILFDLLFSESLRFSDLKPTEMDSTKFLFHLKELIKEGFINKHDGIYTLTNLGKEFANKLDISSLNFSVQAKITTVLCAYRETGSEKEFLLYTRAKNPFFGSTGFPTQKVLYGESLESAAITGLKEETGLVGTPELFAIYHYLVYSEDNLLIEDKLMYAYKFPNPKGELISHIEGDYFWISSKDIASKVTKPLPEFSNLTKALEQNTNKIDFKEISVITKNF